MKKTIGQKNKKSAEWLKAAGYLDTKDQDKISYMFIPPIKDKTNDTAHFIRTEIDSTDLKKENLTSKVEKDSSRKQYIYKKETPKNLESNETIRLLDELATFEPGKKAQLATKKISEKYKKIREANAKKQKNKTSLIDNRTYQ